MPEASVGLADAIRELRRELTEAVTEGQDKQIRFELGPVEMEFLLEISLGAEGNAGVRFWVVSVGGKGNLSSGSTHRVKLTLTPRDHSPGSPPGPVEVSDSEERAALLPDEGGSVGGADGAHDPPRQRSARQDGS